MLGRLGVDNVSPVISLGQVPAKATVGQVFPVSAQVWREGHDAISATLVVRRPAGSEGGRAKITMTAEEGDNVDVRHALFVPDVPGLWTFRVDAWSDPFATWFNAITKKVDAGQDAALLANDLETGARLFERAKEKVSRGHVATIDSVIAALRALETAGPAPSSAAAPGTRAVLAGVLEAGNVGRALVPGKHGAPPTPYALVEVIVPDEPGALARLLTNVIVTSQLARAAVEHVLLAHAVLEHVVPEPQPVRREREVGELARRLGVVVLPGAGDVVVDGGERTGRGARQRFEREQAASARHGTQAGEAPRGDGVAQARQQPRHEREDDRQRLRHLR